MSGLADENWRKNSTVFIRETSEKKTRERGVAVFVLMRQMDEIERNMFNENVPTLATGGGNAEGELS